MKNLIELRERRRARCDVKRCQTRLSRGNLCRKCARLKDQLIDSYKVSDPKLELEGRIAYEFVFDKLSLTSIQTSDWLRDDGRRSDHGHTHRIALVCQRMLARKQSCAWLDVPLAMSKARAPKKSECRVQPPPPPPPLPRPCPTHA